MNLKSKLASVRFYNLAPVLDLIDDGFGFIVAAFAIKPSSINRFRQLDICHSTWCSRS
jgi:hypothetical protein